MLNLLLFKPVVPLGIFNRFSAKARYVDTTHKPNKITQIDFF